MSLLTALAGKAADPAAIETEIRQIVSDEISQALIGGTALADKILDRIKGEIIPEIEASAVKALDGFTVTISISKKEKA